MKVPEINVDEPYRLAGVGSWPDSWHLFDELSRDAILMAWASERPLLVRGQPGTGKSQLARAAAVALDRLFVSEVVHSRIEPQDLLWRFDAISRLGEAQACGLRGGAPGDEGSDPLDPLKFLNPGVLWWAFDWQSALEQHENRCRQKLYKPDEPKGWRPEKGCVLLIDEIDKADSDLPNSLLETLGNRGFAVPWLNQTIGKSSRTPTPLVVITTNEERELPPAFVRRCLVLNLRLPNDLVGWLLQRGRIHFPDIDRCSNQVLEAAACQLVKDREDADQQGLSPPGQAEYIDLLSALTQLAEDEAEQLTLLGKLSQFAFRKHPS